jgi:HK97 family phage prohead protease
MEETQFIFTSEPIQVKSVGNDFFVEGYISTSDLDLVNDIVTKSCLMDMADQMRQRVIKFDVEHEAFRGKSNIEREINKTKIPVAKVDDFLMDSKGIKVRAKLNSHSPRFDEVKGSIEDGFLDAFSIAYVPMKATMVTKNGQKVRMLDKLNLLNVAFTGNPVNTEARMVNVFTKSLASLEDAESQSINDKIKLQEAKNKMSEENEKVDETQESENEAEEKSEAEKKDEEQTENEQESEESEEEDTEVKSLKAEVKSLNEKIEAQNKEIAEVKALLKKPVMKSKVEQKNKSDNFVEEKSSNPLDMIA